MKLLMKVLIFVHLLIGFLLQVRAQGFTAGTLVKIPTGYAAIEKMRAGEMLFACNGAGEYTLNKIKYKSIVRKDCYILLDLGEVILATSPDQQFYLPLYNKWVHAETLKMGDKLLANRSTLVQVVSTERVQEDILMYTVYPIPHYNYCVSTLALHTCN